MGMGSDNCLLTVKMTLFSPNAFKAISLSILLKSDEMMLSYWNQEQLFPTVPQN